MKKLVIYGTTKGQTTKIAVRIAHRLLSGCALVSPPHLARKGHVPARQGW